MAVFNIKENGVVVNTIVADLAYVSKTYAEYEELTLEEDPRLWRDQELERTDKYMMIGDFPAAKDQTMRTYRQALRDWPNTPDFPDTRPTL